jgi:hypothetical protein
MSRAERGHEFGVVAYTGEENSRAHRPEKSESRRALGGRPAGEPPAGSSMMMGTPAISCE